MTNPAPTLSRSTGIWVYGEVLSEAAECDTYAPAMLFDALHDAWPDPAFWASIAKCIVWNPSRQDAPPEFRTAKPAAGLFDVAKRIIHFNTDLFGLDKAGFEAHELGHAWQTFYRIGPGYDSFGGYAWLTQQAMSDNSVETFASNVGREFLRRLRFRNDTEPRGFAQFMDYIKEVRS